MYTFDIAKKKKNRIQLKLVLGLGIFCNPASTKTWQLKRLMQKIAVFKFYWNLIAMWH